MLTVTKESSLSLQPAHDVSGSKTYVLFGIKVTMLLSLVQFMTLFDLSSLQQNNAQKRKITSINSETLFSQIKD